MSDVWDWPLPKEAHVPGQTARPADDDVHRIARQAPAITEPGAWRDNPAYVAGLRLYANGFYWEAHETWEPVWMGAAANSRERDLVQGLIQLANAGLKVRMNRPAAAARLARIAAAHIGEAAYGPTPVVMGVALATMVATIRDFADDLERRVVRDAPPIVGPRSSL